MLRYIKDNIGKIKRAIEGVVQSYKNAPDISSELNRCQIGVSKSSRPISYYKVGSGKIKVLLLFGIHGNEVGTVKLGQHFLNYIEKHTPSLNGLTIFTVPILNVDGYYEALKNPDYWQGGRVGRFNTNNVDLNRNFDTKSFKRESVWSFGKNYSEKSKVFCGEEGNSELETKAATELILRENIDVVYSFHNSGQDVLAGSTKLSKELANIFSRKTGYRPIPHEEWLILKQTGTFKEWCDDRGVSFLEIEGKTRWASDWNNQKDAIMSSLRHLRDNKKCFIPSD